MNFALKNVTRVGIWEDKLKAMCGGHGERVMMRRIKISCRYWMGGSMIFLFSKKQGFDVREVFWFLCSYSQ